MSKLSAGQDRSAATGQAGQALPLLLVAMALGVILISTLLYAVDARLVTARVQVSRAREEYAAGAAVEFALAQLRNGSYCQTPGAVTVFTLPASVNGVTSSASARCVTGPVSGGVWVTQTIPTTADLNGIYCLDASHCWAVGDTGTMLVSTDGGVTWTPQNTAFPPPKDVDGIVFAQPQLRLGGGRAPVEDGAMDRRWRRHLERGGYAIHETREHVRRGLRRGAGPGSPRGWAVGTAGAVVRVDCSGNVQEKPVPGGSDLYRR